MHEHMLIVAVAEYLPLTRVCGACLILIKTPKLQEEMILASLFWYSDMPSMGIFGLSVAQGPPMDWRQ